MDFKSRLDAVFGGLDQVKKSNVPAWTVSSESVFRPGKEAGTDGYSSDDENEDEGKDLLPGSLVDLEDDDDEEEKPSFAFCRQLDKEEEYDDVDDVATGSLRSGDVAEQRPDRFQEVGISLLTKAQAHHYVWYQVLVVETVLFAVCKTFV